ncbi:MAG: hypothetical protein V2A73_00240, partial [Pseudomonadota bacterium]
MLADFGWRCTDPWSWGCDRCSLVPVDGGETRASAIPDVDVSRSDGHDKAPEGAQAVLGLWS